MVASTHFTQPKLQLSPCASNIASTANCAHEHATTSAKNQSARNAAMSGGSRKKQRGGDPTAGDPMAGRITVSQGPAMAGGSVPASPTTGNSNMVGTTQTSVGAQAQTQYDSAVNTSGKIPASSSPRADKNPPAHVQGGGGVLEKDKDDKPVSWLSRLNQSAGGRRRRRRRTRKKKRTRRTRKRSSRKRVHRKTRKRRGSSKGLEKPSANVTRKRGKRKLKKIQKRKKEIQQQQRGRFESKLQDKHKKIHKKHAQKISLEMEDTSQEAQRTRSQLRHSRGVYTKKEQKAFAKCTDAKAALKIDASTPKKAAAGIQKELFKK